MKRVVLFLLIGIFMIPIMAGCAKELTDEEMFAKLGDDKILERASEIIAQKEPSYAQAEATPIPVSAAVEPSPEPTPQRKPLAPMDLLDEKYNPFYNVKFPQGYEPYAAAFDTGDPGKSPSGAIYSLFLTAQGDPTEIVKYGCQLAGFEDENRIQQYVNGMNKDGYCTIDGTTNGKGMSIVCGIKKTRKGADYGKCEDVDGCRLELIASIDNERIPEYRAFLTDNYNLNAFGDLAESLEGSLAPDKFCVEVNTKKPEFTYVHAIHQVNDAAALIKSMSEKLKFDWYDKNGNAIGISYGRIRSDIKADMQSNLIKIDQSLCDSETASRDYIKPDKSLVSLGFNYLEKEALCAYEDKKNGYRISIHKPEWGQRKDKWNIEFFYNTNGYNLVIWYVESEKRYTIQVDKGKSIAKYDYDAANNTYGNEYPDSDTIQKLFKMVFGDSKEYQYQDALDKLNQYISDSFGISMEKLYDLPAK